MKCTSTTSRSRAQRGFSIPAAIFIVVILAALGAFLVTISGNQQLGAAQDVLGSRGLQAARSGIDWGVHQIVNPAAGSTNFRTACLNGTLSANPVSLGTFPGLDGFTVSVACTASSQITDSSRTPSSFYVYQLTAVACTHPNPGCPNTSAALPNAYVERRLTAQVWN